MRPQLTLAGGIGIGIGLALGLALLAGMILFLTGAEAQWRGQQYAGATAIAGAKQEQATAQAQVTASASVVASLDAAAGRLIAAAVEATKTAAQCGGVS
jgi:hypothetical protein